MHNHTKSQASTKNRFFKTAILSIGILSIVRLAHAQCDPPPDEIAAWWAGDGNFSDNAGTNNGFGVNGVGFAPGIVGQAFDLNGVNQYVQIDDSPSLNPSGAISVAAWLFLRQYKTFPSSDNIVVKDNFDLNKRDYVLQAGYTTNGSQISFTVFTSIGRFDLYGGSVSISNWTHIVGTYDGQVGRIYQNGQLVGSVALVLTNGAVLNNTDTPLLIGGNNDQCCNRILNGLVDEVAIFSRALSSNEVAAMYAAGSAGLCHVWITSQPQSQIGHWGQSVSFNVSVHGTAPFGYQWYFGTNLISSQVSSTANASLVLTNLQDANAGSYYVVVTNSSGSITSNPANLTITPAAISIALYPRMTAFYPGVTISGVVGYTYGIQSTTNLSYANSWTGLTNLTFTFPETTWYDSVPASLSTKFYRVLEGPIPIP